METLESSSTKSILHKIFTFDTKLKNDLLNLIQVILIVTIPIVVLSNSIDKLFSKADATKSSFELTIEIFGQLIMLYFGFYFIMHVVSFIPTLSGEKLPEFSSITAVIPTLFALVSSHNDLSDKIKIMFYRFNKLWNGEPQETPKNSKQTVKVSQPISQQQTMYQQPTQQETIGNSSMIQDLPINPSNSQPMQQQYPDYNNMYQNTPTPLIGASSPNMSEGFSDIQPANSVLGNNFGASF